MKKFEYVIKDEIGIHARPAGMLVKEAKKYERRKAGRGYKTDGSDGLRR